MKTILTSIVLLLSSSLYSQVSVELGVIRRSESTINLRDHFLKPLDWSNPYTQTRSYISGEYKQEQNIFSLSLSHFRKIDVEYRTFESSISGGGSSPIFRRSKFYRSLVDYSYIGSRFSYAYSFEGTSLLSKKLMSSIEIGCFLGVDFVSSYSEKGHYSREIEQNNSNWSQTTVTTLDIESHEEFKGVDVRNSLGYMGVSVGRRLQFQRFYLKGMISYGKIFHSRVAPLNSSRFENGSEVTPEEPRKRLFEFQIGIGYQFGREEN